jgi:hypothetical protein
MFLRREILAGVTAVTAAYAGSALAQKPLRLVFVHGRAQQGLDPVSLKSAWLDALKSALELKKLTLPKSVTVEFPYYGDMLEEFVRQSKLPLASEITSRGSDQQDDFLAFQAQVADELAKSAGVTETEINAEYGDDLRARGPLNWKWVQAIIRAIDKNAGGLSAEGIESFTRDVYIYLNSNTVRDAIDQIVATKVGSSATVVVGHSLGSVVAYNVLRKKTSDVSLFVTVGSPLGIRTVRTPLIPIGFPTGVRSWYNAYDPRDIVALNPLDAANFQINPPVENYSGVKNSTANRHGISGYLGDPVVAQKLFKALR